MRTSCRFSTERAFTHHVARSKFPEVRFGRVLKLIILTMVSKDADFRIKLHQCQMGLTASASVLSSLYLP